MISSIQVADWVAVTESIHEKVRSQATRRHRLNFGGNRKLKIYGTLSCVSGKSMKKENRAFFETEEVALAQGYRPCGHCLKEKYKKWKKWNYLILPAM